MNKLLLLAGAIIAASVARPFGEGGVARASEQVMPPAVVGQMRGYVFNAFHVRPPSHGRRRRLPPRPIDESAGLVHRAITPAGPG